MSDEKVRVQVTKRDHCTDLDGVSRFRGDVEIELPGHPPLQLGDVDVVDLALSLLRRLFPPLEEELPFEDPLAELPPELDLFPHALEIADFLGQVVDELDQPETPTGDIATFLQTARWRELVAGQDWAKRCAAVGANRTELSAAWAERYRDSYYARAAFVRVVEGFIDQRHERTEITTEKIASFLEETNGVDLPPAERLRMLAIHLERYDFAIDWAGIRLVYEAAAREEPESVAVYHSWGLSAMHVATGFADARDRQTRFFIANEAIWALEQAIACDPDDGELAHAMGCAHYEHPGLDEDSETYVRKALEWFERALSLAPDMVIAQLYRSYCYCDLGEWERALGACMAVDRERLAAEWPRWRSLKLQEATALCFAHLGNLEEALRQFRGLIAQYDAMDAAERAEELLHLDEMAEAALSVLADEEFRAEVKAAIERFGLQERYQTHYGLT